MHRGFELFIKPSDFNEPAFNKLLKAGKLRYNTYRREIESTIDSFTLSNGKLDGSKMQANWFPQIEADVFISHSHRDEDLAIVISEWLFQTFGLTVFIDSCIWGYSNKLLHIIDKEYCPNPDGKTFDYVKRNYSTSHVHMMLSTALSMMIDKAECVFFLNTPNSISPSDVISKTESPWIYSEIAMTQLIRHKPIEDYRLQVLTESYREGGEIKKGLDVEYSISTKHLTSLFNEILENWEKKWPNKGQKYSPDFSTHALDQLYILTPIKNNNEYFRK